jgi:hypothetical protein
MKEIIKNILKEEQETNELEQRFRNSMAKIQYIVESNTSSNIESLEMIDIKYNANINHIQGTLVVNTYYGGEDLSSIGKHMDSLETEISRICEEFTFTENGGLIKRGSDNDWFLGFLPIGIKWDVFGNEPYLLSLEFMIWQDEYDA